MAETMARANTARDAIRVVSFDLDDTFWDCAPAIANAEQVLTDWYRKHTPRITADNDDTSLLQFRTEVRKRNPQLSGCVTAMRLQGLRELFGAYDYPESLAEKAFEVFYRARSDVRMYPKVTELLEALGKRFKLAAITNGNADLQQIGIAHYFDRVYAADLELLAKPHADMFHRALADFSVDGDQMLHVGDNPTADIAGGLAAGVQTLWFNQHGLAWPATDPAPHYEARSIEQILEFFGH